MDELLNSLEIQIKTLIQQRDQLVETHHSLKAKQQKAIAQINILVNMLKAIEKLP